MRSSSDKKPSVLELHGFDIGTSGSLDDLVKHFQFDGRGIVEIIQNKFPYIFRK